LILEAILIGHLQKKLLKDKVSKDKIKRMLPYSDNDYSKQASGLLKRGVIGGGIGLGTGLLANAVSDDYGVNAVIPTAIGAKSGIYGSIASDAYKQSKSLGYNKPKQLLYSVAAPVTYPLLNPAGALKPDKDSKK
jgi:hypothetical protein